MNNYVIYEECTHVHTVHIVQYNNICIIQHTQIQDEGAH